MQWATYQRFLYKKTTLLALPWIQQKNPALAIKNISFYVNENEEIVICFNEGEVARMYMGTIEFTIPSEALDDIRTY